MSIVCVCMPHEHLSTFVQRTVNLYKILMNEEKKNDRKIEEEIEREEPKPIRKHFSVTNATTEELKKRQNDVKWRKRRK